ncbi:MAG: hypothetical protein ACE5IL_16800 [Myxococcota bacterium]
MNRPTARALLRAMHVRERHRTTLRALSERGSVSVQQLVLSAFDEGARPSDISMLENAGVEVTCAPRLGR